ncbi:nuclear pore complex protein Nup214-like isoform X2 [Actinia tenebrosa]|uniref:Nuclear pore complex protein Nup214-like isoform X2 n=1 Tax=Actinia tenebrosa TaxID=6105 RepID=A0A6P8IEZ9_ACTTE|nr:nuclear pore complex protein Nup214-like isoform X2 [Actinia tenebrosa]
MGDLDSDSFPERKVEDFYFKQLKKLQIFDSPEGGLPLARTSLLAVSNKHGLCFVGCPTGVKIIKTDIIGKLNQQDERNINAVVSEYPSIYIEIGEAVRHVGLSCDNITLSVCYEKGNNVMFRVYDIPTICSQTGSKEMLGEVALSSDGSSLVNLLWNPVIPNIFAACLSNGSVTMWDMSNAKITKAGALPVSTRATAICWSPKGKQIVVGHKDGHLTQYSPALEVKKETPSPEIFKDSPRQVTSICWISAAVFLNVYTTEEEGDIPQCVLVCNALKTSPKQTINFDDVYFGMNEDREKGFYTTHLLEWNVTLSVSCNAFEVAVFGNEEKWEKWTFEDEKRAEMPLTSDNEETYPMGMAIDLTSTIPIVENEHSYPPAPLLLLLSTDGVLCPFYMINKNPRAKHDIVRPAEPLPPPGPRPKIVGDAPVSRKAPEQPRGQQQAVFQIPKTAATLPNTALSQPATKPLPTSSSSSPFSLTSSSSSQPAANAASSKLFNFTTPSTLDFTTTPVKPVTTESKAVASDGVTSTNLFAKKSDSMVPPGSGFSTSGFPIGFTSSVPPSTATPEKPTLQLPTSKTNFQNLFSPQQPSSLPGLEKPTVGSLFKPMLTTQPISAPKETDSLKDSGSLFKPMPTTQPMSAPKETDALKNSGSPFNPVLTTQPISAPKETDALKDSGQTFRSLQVDREKQEQIKKQEKIQLQQQQQQPREQEQLLQQQQQEQQILKQQLQLQLRLRKQEQEQYQQRLLQQQQQQQREQERPLQQQQQQQEQQVLKQQQQLRLRKREQEQYQQRLQQQEQKQYQQQLYQQQQEQQLQQRQLVQQQHQRQQEQEQYQQQMQQHKPQQQQRQLQQEQLEQQQLEPMTKQMYLNKCIKCIDEEIQLISEELEELGENVHQMKNMCSEFVQKEELERLREETELEAKTCDELKKIAKDHNSEIQDAKKKLLSSFEVLEDARVRHHRAKDRRYLHLLKSRGLDPMNANKMKTIRELYMHLDKTLGEVHLVLDEEWNKENESRNKIQRPTMDAVYRTLQAHQRVSQEQSVRLDKIAEKMKRKKLLSLSWNKPSASIVSSRENMNELSSLEGSMKSLDLDTTAQSSIKVPDNIPANKSAQLINMLRKRQTTPIRRSAVVSPNTSRARQIQRRLAEPITNLSPPSRQGRIVSETPLVKSTSATLPLFSSTPAVPSGPEKAFAFVEIVGGKSRESNIKEENAYQTSRATHPSFSSTSAVTGGTREAFSYDEGKSRESIIKEENAYQTSPQSPALFTSLGSTNASKATGETLGFSARPQSIGAPTLSTATTGAPPRMTAPKPIFDKTGLLPQRTGTPPLTIASSNAGTSQSTGSTQMFKFTEPTGTPVARRTGTPPLSTGGFNMAPPSSDKSLEGFPSSFTSKSSVNSTKEAALKLPSAGPGDKTILKQMPQQTPVSSTRDMQTVTPAALAAMSRAEEMRAEKTNLDPSASIEPRSMVTHGQSGGERARDIESENKAAKSIAEEALKHSQLEAEKAGFKPQSSTEFAIKGTESPKPGPPVVTVKPVSSKDKIQPSNLTVKPVPVPATPLTRPSIVPPGSSTTASGFSFGTAKDTVPLKENLGQGTTTKPTSFSFAASLNTKKETETIPAASLGSESSIQPKSSPLNSGIIKPEVISSPGVNRQLFKDSSNQINNSNGQKEQADVPRDLQKLPESDTQITKGTSMGFQLNSSKENVPFSAPTSTSSSSKPNEGAPSFGFKFESPSGSPSFGPVPGKETASSVSSGVKPFSPGSAAGGGLTFGPTSTAAPSNVFRPFANIQTTSSSSPTSSFGSITMSATGVTTPGLFSFSTKDPSSTISATSSSGASSGVGMFTLTPKTTAASSTTVTAVTSAGVIAATSSEVTSSPFSSFTSSVQGSSQGGLLGSSAEAATTTQGRTFKGGLFQQATATSSQGGTPQGGLFGTKPTTSTGETSQGNLFGTKPTTSTGGTSQGGFFGAQTSDSQDGLFGTTTTSPGGTSQGGLFGSSQASQGGGLFGVSTTSQSGTGQFGSPSSSSSSAFGQPTFGQPAFGQSTSTVTSPTSSAFGQSAFSKPQETTSTGTGISFGGFGLGGQPSQQAIKNPFLASATSSPSAGTSLFGANTSTGFKPTFGSGTPSSFSPQSSGGFGGGSFTKGTGNVASSGFSVGGGGSPGFGGSPSFGSAPVFGSSQSFGSSAPAFGSAPVFGSSPQLGMATAGGFGSSTGSGSFGNVSGSPLFGALAHQSATPSFGNVAQQAQQGQPGFGGFGQQSAGFGGFGSPGGGPGASPAFGGSPSQSFNQWR